VRTPQAIWDEHIGMANQDMRDYMPFLSELARGNVLEIGVRGGVSTSPFLLGIDDKESGYLYSIDIDAHCGAILEHPRWKFIHADSQVAVPPLEWNNKKLSVLLIDGDHHYPEAISDLRKWSSCVEPGGTILMHDVLPSDYARSCCPEIDECRKAWDEFCAAHSAWPNHIMPGLFGMGVIQKPA